MLEWIVHYIATGTLAVVFALALGHKLRGYARFRASLQAYGIVPELLLGIVTPLIVGIEVLALLLLLLPVTSGSLLAFSLLGTYTAAIAINLARGRSYIDCGCGDLPTPLSSWLLLRNGLLMVLAWPYGAASGYVGSAAAWGLVGVAVAVCVVFYLTTEQLLANTGLIDANHG